MASITPPQTTTIAGLTFYPRDESEVIEVPSYAHTHEGFRQWALSGDFPERGKITFVAGELIIDMSPESIEIHSQIKTEISRVLASLVREESLGWLHIDGVLISTPAAGVSNEPDALFISRETLKSGRLKFTPEKSLPQSSKEIVGAPDWVLEIVSPSSIKKDKQLLRDAYFRAGIGEYWIIDALSGQIEFQVLVPGETGYDLVEPADGWLKSPTFGKAFRLTRDVDEDGWQQYTLHFK